MKKINYFKKAFTLAEVMITLTVIGIITAVIVPIAFQSKPDENVMKFKKGHNTLYQAISTLVNSDKYYLDGDLGKKPNGSLVQDESYFCNTFADVVSTKTVDCATSYGDEKVYADTRKNYTTDKTFTLEHIKTTANRNVDYICSNVQKNKLKANKQIVTTDGIVWFEESKKVPFGFYWTGTTRLFSDPSKAPNYPESNGFDAIYKVFCMDVDGYSGTEAPFGYAIRADGKIIPGKRADDWLAKNIQGEN